MEGRIKPSRCLRPSSPTSFHHQPEAQHPKSSAIHKLGRPITPSFGMGAAVTVAAHSARTAEQLTRRFDGCVRAIAADQRTIEQLCTAADVVIGAVLVPGGAAPKLISAKTIAAMKRGSVLVDVSIDQGGCSETSLPTTHSQPTYVVDGVVHYCVANMPGAVPRTSTFALNDATRPFVLALADKGISRALQEDAGLRSGLNAHEGRLTNRPVADALGLTHVPAS